MNENLELKIEFKIRRRMIRNIKICMQSVNDIKKENILNILKDIII